MEHDDDDDDTMDTPAVPSAKRLSKETLDQIVIHDWAAAEGWNPGLDDAAALYATDPDGYWMLTSSLCGDGGLPTKDDDDAPNTAEAEDTPIAAVSVVRHSPSYAFVGFYLCHPEWRGRGHGLAVWKAALAANVPSSKASNMDENNNNNNDTFKDDDSIVIGLDGVLAQQANYERSGFRLAHMTQRYEGMVDTTKVFCKSTAAGTGAVQHPNIRQVDLARDECALQDLDQRIQGGVVTRHAFVKHWFTDTETRHTLVVTTNREASVTDDDGMAHDETTSNNNIVAVGTIRECQNQSFKVGPLFAPDVETAERLLERLVRTVATTQRSSNNNNQRFLRTMPVKIVLDVPSPNHDGVALAEQWGLTPVFACARMYKGTPVPARTLSQIFGESTFELG